MASTVNEMGGRRLQELGERERERGERQSDLFYCKGLARDATRAKGKTRFVENR